MLQLFRDQHLDLDGYFRISYATSIEVSLKKAMDRIKSFCESLE